MRKGMEKTKEIIKRSRKGGGERREIMRKEEGDGE